MRYTGPSPAVVRVVKGRLGGLCLRACGEHGDVTHHRRPRGSGGTSDPAANRPDNCVWICWVCHADIELGRSSAYAAGWLVKHGIDEPHEVPLTDLRGSIFFLSEEGDVIPLAGPNEPPF